MASKQGKTKTWADYELPGWENASQKDLVKAVRKAAKAANQRLRRLEAAGATKGVYQRTIAKLGRKRFQERPDKMTLNALRREYKRLRSFISAQTSTVKGRKESDIKRYQTAVSRGYKGTMEDFYDDIEKYFDEKTEKYFSSKTVYSTIVTGESDIIDQVIQNLDSRSIEESRQKGEALRELIKLKRGKK